MGWDGNSSGSRFRFIIRYLITNKNPSSDIIFYFVYLYKFSGKEFLDWIIVETYTILRLPRSLDRGYGVMFSTYAPDKRLKLVGKSADFPICRDSN